MPTLRPPEEPFKIVKLPKPLQDYIEFPQPSGTRNDALLAASCQARDVRWTETETMSRLLALATERDGLPENEARATIHSAYTRDPRDVPRGTMTIPGGPMGTWRPSAPSPAKKEIAPVEYELDPEFKLPAPIANPVIPLLEALYKPGEYVFFMGATYDAAVDAKEKPDRYDTNNIWNRDALLKVLREKTGGTLKGIEGFDIDKGLYFNINPLSKTAKGRTKEEVQEFRYGLIEFDHIPREQQYQVLVKSNLPICALIDSGRNSIHAIVKIDAGRDEPLFKARMNAILHHFKKYDVDPKNNDVTRLSRFPGVTRSDSKGAQLLLSLATGLPTYEEWERAMVVEEDGLPAIEDMFDLLEDYRAGKLIEPQEVIQGVAHVGCKLVFGGASKARKTWALADLAASVMSGGKWFDFLQCNQGNVLYLNMELPKYFMVKRVDMILKAKGIDLKERGRFKMINLRGFSASLTLLRPKLEQAIEGINFSLILLDPTYKLMPGGDENGTSDSSILLNEIERLAVKSGALCAFGSHFSKGNQSLKKSMDRISGSGVFARDPDSIITMTEHSATDALSVECNLRNHAPMPDFVVRWETPLFKIDRDLDPTALAEAPVPSKGGGRPKKTVEVTESKRNEILKFVDENPGCSTAQLVTTIQRFFKEDNGTARQVLKQLVEEEILVKQEPEKNGLPAKFWLPDQDQTVEKLTPTLPLPKSTPTFTPLTTPTLNTPPQRGGGGI
jgi:RecA-family ATPase